MSASSRESQLVGYWADIVYGIFQIIISGIATAACMGVAAIAAYVVRSGIVLLPIACLVLFALYCVTRIVAATGLVVLRIQDIRRLPAATAGQ